MKKVLIVGAVMAGITFVFLVVVIAVSWRPVMHLTAHALTTRGMKLAAVHRNDEALRAYNSALMFDDHYAVAYARRAYLEIDMKRFKDALRDGDQAVALDRTLALDWAARGYAHEWLDQNKEARDDYNQAIQIAPNVALYHTHLSYIETRSNDLEKARAEIARAIELDPNSSQAYDDRALLDLTLGDPAEAESDDTHAIALSPNWAAAYAHRAWVRIWSEKFDEAIRDADDAFKLKPDYGYALYIRGVAQRRKGDLQSAVESVTRLLSIEPEYPGAHFERAIAYFDLGKLDSAKNDLMAGESGPDPSGREHLWLWIVDSETGHGKDADLALSGWLANKPPNALAQKLAALLLGRTTPDALAQDEASAKSPALRQASLCEIWYYTGEAALIKNDHIQARADFQKAIDSKAVGKAEFGEAQRELARL